MGFKDLPAFETLTTVKTKNSKRFDDSWEKWDEKIENRKNLARGQVNGSHPSPPGLHRTESHVAVPDTVTPPERPIMTDFSSNQSRSRSIGPPTPPLQTVPSTPVISRLRELTIPDMRAQPGRPSLSPSVSKRSSITASIRRLPHIATNPDLGKQYSHKQKWGENLIPTRSAPIRATMHVASTAARAQSSTAKFVDRRLASLEPESPSSWVLVTMVPFFLTLMVLAHLFFRRATAPRKLLSRGTRIVRKKAPTRIIYEL